MTDRIDFEGSSRARDLRNQADQIDHIAEVAWQFVSLCRKTRLEEFSGPFDEDGYGWAWRYLEEALKGQEMMDPEHCLVVEFKAPYRPSPPDPNRRKPLSQSVRTAVFERDEYACTKCGVRRGLSVDHIYPVSAGGTNDMDNLRTLCKSCNSSKGARIE